MKSLIITAWAPAGRITLPVAYQPMVQGMFYTAWRETLPFLHDHGFSEGDQGYRLFVFGPLQGHYQYRDGLLHFDSPITLELRSPIDAVVDAAAELLMRQSRFLLGSTMLEVKQMELRSMLRMPTDAIIHMCSPVCAYKTLSDKKTRYFSPEDPEWAEQLFDNLCGKLNVLGLPDDSDLFIVPVAQTLRKRVARFKGTYITGYEGDFVLRTSEEAMAALYYSGLGSRNSQGFGMFEIAKILRSTWENNL